MAPAQLTPLQAWRRDWVTLKTMPSLTQVRQRLAAVGPTVDWADPVAEGLLRQWLDHLDFTRHLQAALKHLDVLAQSKLLPMAWGLPLKPALASSPTLVERLLDSRSPLLSNPQSPVYHRWVKGCQTALADGPALNPHLDQMLQDRGVMRLWTGHHETVLAAVCATRPQTMNEPWVYTQSGTPKITVWATQQTTEAQWRWMSAQGLKPTHAVAGQRPFWWLACEQGCEPAWAWAKEHLPEEAEMYRVFRYFRALAKPTHRETPVYEQYQSRLFRRPDWATVKNEEGCPAVWHMAHHHLEWLCHLLPDYLLAQPQWRTTTDAVGRNLAVAVVSYQGTNTNDNRATALRRLALEHITPGPDGLGRGLMISLPHLKASEIKEVLATYPQEERWWQGSSDQVDAALRLVGHTPNLPREWLAALAKVSPSNPVLRGAHWVLALAENHSFPPDKQNLAWPTALDDSPVMAKALASAQGPALQALRQASQTLDQGPLSPRSRPRLRS